MNRKNVSIEYCNDCPHVLKRGVDHWCRKEKPHRQLPDGLEQVGYMFLISIPLWCSLDDAPEEPSLPAEENNRPTLNYCGNNSYYCNSCGLELSGNNVDIVVAGNNYANGEFYPCPECSSENGIDREDAQ